MNYETQNTKGALYSGFSMPAYQPPFCTQQRPVFFEPIIAPLSPRPILHGIGSDFVPSENVYNKLDYLRRADRPTIFY